ncbi:hypothetical protein G7Y79_00011g031580 [Physcia stellaris]|nr:hypothetical protein G7Y79_00011g031580 [Physcia stellaris]
MNAKFHYDRKHQPLYMKPGDYALIQLHKGYNIPSATSKKIDQQYVGPFLVTEKVGNLAYRLAIPDNWRIDPIFSVAQLETCPAPGDDPYHRPRPDHPDSVYVEGDTPTVKSFEIERLINKRKTAKRGPEYLVRWKGYGPEHDVWRNLPELGNAMDLVWEYEDAIGKAVTLPGRRTDPAVASKPLPKKQSFAVVIPPKPVLRKPSADPPSPAPSTSGVLVRKPVTTPFESSPLRRSSRLRGGE